MKFYIKVMHMVGSGIALYLFAYYLFVGIIMLMKR